MQEFLFLLLQLRNHQHRLLIFFRSLSARSRSLRFFSPTTDVFLMGEARREAETLARGGAKPQPWDEQMRRRQAEFRATYQAAAKVLAASGDPRDQALSREVQAFVKSMPAPVSRKVALARQMVVERQRARTGPEATPDRPAPDKGRGRGR